MGKGGCIRSWGDDISSWYYRGSGKIEKGYGVRGTGWYLEQT